MFSVAASLAHDLAVHSSSSSVRLPLVRLFPWSLTHRVVCRSSLKAGPRRRTIEEGLGVNGNWHAYIYICINTAHLFPWVESMDLLSHLPLTTPLRHDNATHANTTAVIIYRIRIRICITFGKCFFIVSTAIRLVFSFNGY